MPSVRPSKATGLLQGSQKCACDFLITGWLFIAFGPFFQRKASIKLVLHASTVDQYEAEFARLVKFASTMVENPRDKAWRLWDGFKPNLQSHILSHDIKDYGEMYRRVQIIERDWQERATASGSRFAQNRDNRRFAKKPMINNRRFASPVRWTIGKPSP